MKDRVKAIRREAGLSQADFAREIGVSVSSVQKWETGQHRLPGISAGVIAARFGVDPGWLLTGEGEMHRDMSTAEKLHALADDIGQGRASPERQRLAEWIVGAADEDLRELFRIIRI